MTPYDPKKKRLNLSAPAFEHAVQRDVPENPVPLGELPGAENAPSVRSTDDLLRHLLAQSASNAQPNPSPAGGLSGVLRQDLAPAPPPVPGPRFRRPTGYRIPVMPQREKPMRSIAELLGLPTSPEAERKALYDHLLKAAVAEREAVMGSKHGDPKENTDQNATMVVSQTALGGGGAIDEQEELKKLRRNTDPKMIVRMSRNRIWAIQNNRKVIFNIKENPKLTGDAPIYRNHESGFYAVQEYDHVLYRESRRFGVDPDLVRAIMYVENSDGHRFGIDEMVQRVGVADTLLPMNINPEIWSGVGGVSREEFSDPEKNIRAGVALIREIQDRIVNPTPAKVGSIWQFTGSEAVRENGAKIEKVMRERLWEIPPEEGIPEPHVP